MNQSQLLAKKYDLPESREISLGRDKAGWRIFKELPLNRDIAALTTLQLEHDIWTMPFSNLKYVATQRRIGYDNIKEKYDTHPTKLDALCECLCQALLAE